MGYEVRKFERDDVLGGNWPYTDEVPLDASVPNVGPYFSPDLPPYNVELPYKEHHPRVETQVLIERRKDHRAPKQIYG